MSQWTCQQVRQHFNKWHSESVSECIGKLRLAHTATHFLSHSLVRPLILQLTNWLTHLPTYRVTHWLTNCLTHHLLSHSPIQSLNRVTATRVTHGSSNPYFPSISPLKTIGHMDKKDPRILETPIHHPLLCLVG